MPQSTRKHEPVTAPAAPRKLSYMMRSARFAYRAGAPAQQTIARAATGQTGDEWHKADGDTRTAVELPNVNLHGDVLWFGGIKELWARRW